MGHRWENARVDGGKESLDGGYVHIGPEIPAATVTSKLQKSATCIYTHAYIVHYTNKHTCLYKYCNPITHIVHLVALHDSK